MNSTKVWKGDRENYTPNYNFNYRPFGLSKSQLKKVNSLGYEEAVNRILKQVRELELITQEDLIIRECPFDKNNPRNNIVCWTCKRLGHYSRDCVVSKLKLKAKVIERSKSTLSTRTIGSQTEYL